MTLDEIRRLFRTCSYDRLVLYKAAFYTGLRANELQSLTVFDLDRTREGLRLHAARTKARKDGFQPLPVGLTAELADYADRQMAKQQYEKAYARASREYPQDKEPLLYVPSHTSLALEQDLKRAGIPKETHEGVMVFHS